MKNLELFFLFFLLILVCGCTNDSRTSAAKDIRVLDTLNNVQVVIQDSLKLLYNQKIDAVQVIGMRVKWYSPYFTKKDTLYPAVVGVTIPASTEWGRKAKSRSYIDEQEKKQYDFVNVTLEDLKGLGVTFEGRETFVIIADDKNRDFFAVKPQNVK